MKKIRVTSLIVAVSILLISIPVGATDKASRENTGLSSDKVTEMTKDEYTYVFTEIARDSLLKDIVATDIYYNSFTQECAFKYSDYVQGNSLKAGSIIERSVEYIKPENSATGDTIVMVNLKAQFIQQYNLCYLFEYHIDTSGKICDFTVWQY